MARAGIGDSLEGFHAVDAAVARGRVRRLVVEAGRLRRPEMAALVARARDGGAAVEVVDDVRPLAVTGAPQGVVAAAAPIPPTDLETAARLTQPAALLVLDHVEDPRNVGAAARSCLAAGVRAMVVPVHRAAPLGATAFKAAAGALEDVAVVEVTSVADALSRLSRIGVWTVGLAAAGTESLFGLGLLTEPVALVLGAEGAGLSRLVAERVDVTARIPLASGVESLNASVAAALAVFEVARIRGWVS
jgi:23S rRNA (guanosine2251-2'-O)-methyltransferase